MNILVRFQPDTAIMMVTGGELIRPQWPKNRGMGDNQLEMMPLNFSPPPQALKLSTHNENVMA
jgi:hypothetical protein